MSIENLDGFGGEAQPIDVALLTDELHAVFKNNPEACAFSMPEDLFSPVDVTLAGTITYKSRMVEVIVSQRATGRRVHGHKPGDEDVCYLVQTRCGGANSWSLVDGGVARSVWHGMPALSANDVAALRGAISPHFVVWSKAQSEQEAGSAINPFSMAKHFDQAA